MKKRDEKRALLAAIIGLAVFIAIVGIIYASHTMAAPTVGACAGAQCAKRGVITSPLNQGADGVAQTDYRY